MLLSQTTKGNSKDQNHKHVRRMLYLCIGTLCSIFFTYAGPVAARPLPAAPVPQASSGHSITIGWGYTQGTDLATGFNCYRSTTSGGPYAKLTTTPLALSQLSFADTTGNGGTKYFYVVTAIDSLGVESVNSPEASATFIASSPNAPTGTTATAK